MEKEYKPSTMRLIEILKSDDFKKKKITKYALWKEYGFSKEVIKYHHYRLYFPERFKKRYLSTTKTVQ